MKFSHEIEEDELNRIQTNWEDLDELDELARLAWSGDVAGLTAFCIQQEHSIKKYYKTCPSLVAERERTAVLGTAVLRCASSAIPSDNKPATKIYDGSKMTPLHWAAFGGHSEAISKLLSVGFSVNIRDAFGQTAGHAACRDGRVDAILTLAQHGCDLALADDKGYTPVHVAAQVEH